MKLSRLFSKNKSDQISGEKAGNSTTARQPEIFLRFNEMIERQKIRVAGLLTRWSERVSVRTKKIILIVFGVSVSVLSLSLILSPALKSSFRHTSASFRADKHHQPSAPPGAASAISKKDFETMVSFKHMLDSLKIYDVQSYRMLIQGRQGLLDSIDFLIRYHDQK